MTMKQLAVLVLTLWLTALPALAAGPEDQPLLYDGAELERICAELNWTLSEEQQQAYKVFTLDREDLFSALDSGVPMEDILSAEYYWVVPGYDSSKTILKRKDGVWDFSESHGPSKTADDTLDHALVKRALQTMPSARVQCFYSQVYRSYFVWFHTDGEEGLMVFSSRPDFTLLENGVLYPVEDVRKALVESGNFTEPTGAEGSPWLWLPLVIVPAALAAAGCLLKKRK